MWLACTSSLIIFKGAAFHPVITRNHAHVTTLYFQCSHILLESCLIDIIINFCTQLKQIQCTSVSLTYFIWRSCNDATNTVCRLKKWLLDFVGLHVALGYYAVINNSCVSLFSGRTRTGHPCLEGTWAWVYDIYAFNANIDVLKM